MIVKFASCLASRIAPLILLVISQKISWNFHYSTSIWVYPWFRYSGVNALNATKFLLNIPYIYRLVIPMKPQWNLQETINSILMKHSFCHFFGSTICQFRGRPDHYGCAAWGKRSEGFFGRDGRGDIVGSENQLGHSITMEMFHWRIWVNRTIIVRFREIIPFLWPQDSGEWFFFNNLPRTIY